MKRYEHDPESMVDTYYGISKQMIDHPDERITWLESLSKFYVERNYLQEAAQTKIATAILVQGYLTALGRWDKVCIYFCPPTYAIENGASLPLGVPLFGEGVEFPR